MNNSERENDVKEFKKLKNSLNSLWKEIDKDNNNDDFKIFSGTDKEEFEDALSEASKFVDSISSYYDNLEDQIIFEGEYDYKDRDNKTTKKVIKRKKECLDELAEELKECIEHPKLRNLFLEVTLRCNAKCEHCGSSCGYKIPKDEISADELKKALKEIADKYGSNNVFLTVTGGEPLMRKDLFDIMGYAKELGFRWGMTTNGMLIDEKVIEKLKETNFQSISISLDGLKETHEGFRKVPGSFDKIKKAIKLLQGMDTLKILQISTVANKKNIGELEDMYKFLLDMGIKDWRVMCVDPIGRASDNNEILLGKDELTYMYNFIREKRVEGKMTIEDACSHYLGLQFENSVRDHGFICGAGIFIGSILSNGDICVCPNVRRKELVQGNIKTDSIVDVWENRYKEFRKNRLTTNEKCRKCKSFKYCRGGSFHTWDFDENRQNMCMKELLCDEFIE